MTAIGRIFLWLWSLIVALFGGNRLPTLYRVKRVEDLPDTLSANTLYVAGEGEYVWAVVLLCPCGCGDQIQLNLLKAASPRWTVHQDEVGRPSLKPSVWRRKGCRSHFILRRGAIIWCTSGAESGNEAMYG